MFHFFFFQAEDGIRDSSVTGVQTCALPICLTGESVPVEKQVEDQVFAGTLNQQGALEVRTTRAAGDTTLARIVSLVREAREQKARSGAVPQGAGRYYTLAVILGATLIMLVPPLA